MKARREGAPSQSRAQGLAVRHVRKPALEFPFMFMNEIGAYPLWLSQVLQSADTRQFAGGQRSASDVPTILQRSRDRWARFALPTLRTDRQRPAL
jgi:hypothetical protein